MKFDHPEYKDCSFDLPDEWTVRQVLKYDSIIEIDSDDSMYERLWRAFQSVVDPDEWHIKDVDLNTSLDDSLLKRRGRKAKKVIDVMKWAGRAGFSARRSLDPDEKN